MVVPSYQKEIQHIGQDMERLSTALPKVSESYSKAQGAAAELKKAVEKGPKTGPPTFGPYKAASKAEEKAAHYGIAVNEMNDMLDSLKKVEDALKNGPLSKERAVPLVVDLNILKSIADKAPVSDVSAVYKKVKEDVAELRERLVADFKVTKKEIAQY